MKKDGLADMPAFLVIPRHYGYNDNGCKQVAQ